MNCKQWHSVGSILDYTYYNKVREIQKSLNYNQDPNAVVIHHLRDTEEQRRYNDEYYELWGHSLDGTFEYGKYVIFVTKEEHTRIHSCSEETKKKISESNKANYPPERRMKVSITHRGKIVSDEARIRMSKSAKNRLAISEDTRRKYSIASSGRRHTEETKKKISESNKANYPPERRLACSILHKGKKLSDETREKLRLSHIGKFHTDQTKKKMSASQKDAWDDERRKRMSKQFSGERNPNYGRHLSDDRKADISKQQKQLWSDDSYRLKMSAALAGKTASDETRRKMSNAHKLAMEETKIKYKQYKESGGSMMWNEFQSYLRQIRLENNNND